jgi:hypothetical protein
MIENYEEEILILLNQHPRPSIEQISQQLINNHGDLRGFSGRSVRRFIKEKNLFNRCSTQHLRDEVEARITEVTF